MNPLRPIALVLVSLTLIGSASAAVVALPAKVTLNGVGGVRPGFSVAQAQARWGITLRLEDEFGPACSAAAVRKRPLRGYAIFIKRRFGAVFFRQGAETDTGIRIGSSLAALRKAYGSRLSSRPNKYLPGARNYFVRRARKPRWELRFDVSPTGRVTTIAFGNAAVRLLEGCA